MATATLSLPEHLTKPIQDDHAENWTDMGQYDPTFVADVERELDGLAALEPNWDGYGAPEIKRNIIAAAKKFIRALPPITDIRPHVVPMSSGNLQFEWDKGPKSVELEFETARVIHFLQWHPEDGVEEESTFAAVDVDRAADLLRWLFRGN